MDEIGVEDANGVVIDFKTKRLHLTNKTIENVNSIDDYRIEIPLSKRFAQLQENIVLQPIEPNQEPTKLLVKSEGEGIMYCKSYESYNWACETFWPYVIGSKFTVETDHKSLELLMKAEKPARLVRWALPMSEFDCRIVYKSGAANGSANLLSRLPIVSGLFNHDLELADERLIDILTVNQLEKDFSSLSINSLVIGEMAQEQAMDPGLATII